MNRYWRLTNEDYKKMKKDILKRKETPDDWARISLDPTTSDTEKMCRIMMNNDPDCPKDSYICMSYMCSSLTLSQEFIEDAMYINSGLWIPEFGWDEEIMDYVLDLFDLNNTKLDTRGMYITDEIIDTYESKKFATSKPKFHKFLKELLVDYYKALDAMEEYKKENYNPDIDDVRKHRRDSIKYYVNMYKLVEDVNNFRIILKNRLDWDQISTQSFDKEFVKKYSFFSYKGKPNGESEDSYESEY